MNLQKKRLTLFIVAVAILSTAGSGVFTKSYCQATASIAGSTKAANSDTAPEQPVFQPPVDVNIFVNVPHNLRAVDMFTAFPYPVKPPPIAVTVQPLSTKRKDIENSLMRSGYADRTSDQTPWAGYGWRWRYAVEAAVKKSGLGYPHTMFDCYSWSRDMAPHILPLLIRINAVEKLRSQRYDQANEFYDNNGIDLENEATRKGYSAGPLHMVHNKCHVKLPPGNWWITGRHQVTGLIYYWQIPITIKAGQPQNVNLTEWNALIIQGAW